MEEVFTSIFAAGNTSKPCLLVILQKGYTIKIYRTEDPGYTFFEAVKDNHGFSAVGFTEILGLITLWENRGDDWRLSEEEYAQVEKAFSEAEIVLSEPQEWEDED